MITWTIGAGGLLGSALVRRAQQSFDPIAIPWDDSQNAKSALIYNALRFQDQAQDQPWAVFWAAGNAATASSTTDAQKELQTFEDAVSAIKAHPPAGKGAFFLSSSAGGVYAGSHGAPFTENSAVEPLSAYGVLKLEQEVLATQELAEVCNVVIGRISNLYGPGQNLDKLQGLISRLAWAAVTKQPVNMFVSLDTIRDYIYVDDAAAVIHYWANAVVNSALTGPRTRVIASGHPVSLGYLIHLMQEISRTKIPVAYGVHASASAQSLDLRLIPSGTNEIHKYIQTPLAVGAKNVYLDILERFQRGMNK